MLNRPLPAPTRDIALLIGRIVLGVVLFAHGWQKLVINGIAGTYGQFEKLGIPLAIVSASFTSFVEFVGGALLIVGALTTTVVALDLVVMVGAAGFVHVTHGIFAQNGGWELVGVIVAAELAIAATGPGRFSVDHLVSSRRAREEAPPAPAPVDDAFAVADPHRRSIASQFVRLSPDDTGPIAVGARQPRPTPRPTPAQQVAIAKVAARPEGAVNTERLQQVPPAARPATVAELVAATGPRPVVGPADEAPAPAPDAAEPRPAAGKPVPVAAAPLFEPRHPLVDAQPAFGPRPVDTPRPVTVKMPAAAAAPISVQRPGELPQRIRRSERVGPAAPKSA